MVPRVAIVHDWMVSMRGGERVLESLCRLFPQAPVFTLRYRRDAVSPELAARDVRTAFTDRLARHLPLGAAEFRALLPLFPLAVESFQLDGFDLIVSSSHAVAKGAIAPPGALHVSYVHSPMRYIWEANADYQPAVPGGPLGRLAFAALGHYLREMKLIEPPVTLTVHQGVDMGRPSLLIVDVDDADQRIRVGGHAVPIPHDT